MKKLVLPAILVLLSLTSINLIQAQVQLSGNLSGVLTDTTYLVTASVYVQPLDSLVIEPGAVILFGNYYQFQILGYLHAVGTPTDSIIFRPAGEDSIGSVIFGSNITMLGASRACSLSYCLFTGFTGSAINSYYGRISISHCTVTGNRAQWGGGIYLRTDSSLISDCLISNNQSRKNGGGIYCTTSAVPIITNCVISGNTCNLLHGDSGHGGGGLCANHSASPVISNCTFSGNHSNTAGGGLTLNDACMALVSHCVINGNSADSCGGGGIAVLKSEYSPSSPIITNCTIANNSAVISTDATLTTGGGLYIQGSTPKLINTVVFDNRGRTAVYFDSSADALISYCDFYNPLTDNFSGLAIPANLGQLSRINANGDSCDASFNLLMNPLFVNSPAGDYHLQEASPCIDAGDPSSPYDPDTTVADIGVFYFDQNSPVINPRPQKAVDGFHGVRLQPNPFNLTTAISYQLSAFSPVNLRVYNIAGRLIETLVNDWQYAGSHQATFDGSKLASGIYIYRLTTNTGTVSGKMVLMK